MILPNQFYKHFIEYAHSAGKIYKGYCCDSVAPLRRSDEGFLARKTEDSLKIRWHEIRNLPPLGYSFTETQKHCKPTNLVWRKVLAKN